MGVYISSSYNDQGFIDTNTPDFGNYIDTRIRREHIDTIRKTIYRESPITDAEAVILLRSLNIDRDKLLREPSECVCEALQDAVEKCMPGSMEDPTDIMPAILIVLGWYRYCQFESILTNHNKPYLAAIPGATEGSVTFRVLIDVAGNHIMPGRPMVITDIKAFIEDYLKFLGLGTVLYDRVSKLLPWFKNCHDTELVPAIRDALSLISLADLNEIGKLPVGIKKALNAAARKGKCEDLDYLMRNTSVLCATQPKTLANHLTELINNEVV